MCNAKWNLKKHCNAVHQMDYPPPDVNWKRIKIVPQIQGISDTVAISNDAVNTGTVAIGSTAGNSVVVAVNNSSEIPIEDATGNANTCS